ncbi:MAG: phage tail protein [Sphingobium sp.]|uniref:phage tail protein n=1 Tax=Sphingobium sp. TaxID=1912891 RepID=UPI003BAF3654
MLKPDRLRAALVEAAPEYGRDPDRLAIYIDQGRVATRLSPGNASFEYRYRLRATLLDFTGHPDIVMVALVKWLSVEQPDLLQRHETGSEAIGFEADVLAGGAIDLDISLQLTEAVVLRPREGGGHDLVHLEEPALAAPVYEGFEGLDDSVALGAIWLGGEQILPG